MTDTLTPTKGLAQQTVGGNDDIWGDILNTTIRLIDSALGGTLDRILTGDTTLTNVEVQNTGYHFRGSLLELTTVMFPTYFGIAVIRNSADQPVSCGMAGGRFVTVPTHGCATIWSDGTDFTDVNQFLTVGGGLHGLDAPVGSGADGGSLVNLAGAGDGAGAGGWASLAGGRGGISGAGGAVYIVAGNGGTVGGDAYLEAGDAQQVGDGGHVWITSGKGKGPGHRAGNIVLATYESEGGATPGDLRLDLGGGGLFITGLPSSDPLRTGTFWLNNGVLIQSGKVLATVFTGTGLSFGSVIASSVTDLSKHLTLHANAGIGLNVTTGRLNFVTATASSQVHVIGGTDVLTLTNTDAILTKPLTLPNTAPSAPTHAASKAYVDGQITVARNNARLQVQWTNSNVSDDTVWLSYDTPYSGTINSLTYFTGNGSFNVAIQINGISVTGLSAVAVSSATAATVNATAAKTFTAGQRITALITGSTGSPTDALLSLNVTWS